MSAPPPDLSDLDGLRVLVVEDSWQVSHGLKHLLEAWGVTVLGPAPTSADAMRLISDGLPDVALVDINLRDGERSYDLIDALHARNIRVVVLTGYADVSVQSDKAVTVLQKPFRQDVLIASLRKPPSA